MDNEKLAALIEYGAGFDEQELLSKVREKKELFRLKFLKEGDRKNVKFVSGLNAVTSGSEQLLEIYKYHERSHDKMLLSISNVALYSYLNIRKSRCYAFQQRHSREHLVLVNASFEALLGMWLGLEKAGWVASEYIRHMDMRYDCARSFDCEYLWYSYVLIKRFYGQKVSLDALSRLGRFGELYHLLDDASSCQRVISKYLDVRIDQSYKRIIEDNPDADAWFCGDPFKAIFPFEVLLLLKLIERERGLSVVIEHEFMRGWDGITYQEIVENEFARDVETAVIEWEKDLGLPEVNPISRLA